MKIKNILLGISLTASVVLTSCSTPKDIAYMQNATIGQEEMVLNMNEIKVQPYDQISIVVSCKEPELMQLFNLVQANNRIGQQASGGGSSQGNVSCYTISPDGDINFPVLGKIHVAGLNRAQISDKIATELKDGKWVSDPTVTVEFANLHFSVLGEVSSPGTYAISNDRVTLLEALAKAGDLTEFGVRDILVIREENGKRIKHKVDLKDDALFNSPVFYLKQNDVVYVSPNDAVARKSSDDPNNWKSISLWMSIATFLTTMGMLIAK